MRCYVKDQPFFIALSKAMQAVSIPAQSQALTEVDKAFLINNVHGHSSASRHNIKNY